MPFDPDWVPILAILGFVMGVGALMIAILWKAMR